MMHMLCGSKGSRQDCDRVDEQLQVESVDGSSANSTSTRLPCQFSRMMFAVESVWLQSVKCLFVLK